MSIEFKNREMKKEKIENNEAEPTLLKVLLEKGSALLSSIVP
jgi:hypothetical protein